jgi:hypothetical protein
LGTQRADFREETAKPDGVVAQLNSLGIWPPPTKMDDLGKAKARKLFNLL